MDFLHALESIRTPFLDGVFSLVTMLGEETVFMVVGMLLLWCFDKKWGYRFFFIGLVGNTLNQLLKAIFLIPRPWVLDPNFTIVESAREAATGYSFPSGHTQTAVTVFGTTALWQKRRWVTVCCICAILLAGFSRMYLGVHTPLDVSVSLLTGTLCVFGISCWFDRVENSPRGKFILGACAAAFAFVLLFYVRFAPVREANIAEFDAHGIKNAWKLIGTMLGLMLAWYVDEKHTRYDNKALWWAQIIKLVLGLGIIVAIKAGLKPVLNAIFGGHVFADALRYFLMAAAGGVFWPMTFPFFAKLGRKGTK